MRMLEIGVCGTDKEIARFKYGEPPGGSDRLIIGHESLGEVIETASDVKSITRGDLVVPSVRRPCLQPECSACAIGRQDFCYTGKYRERGIKSLDGFMTEVVVEKERYLHRVPPGLRDVAVLTEPLTISRKAIRQIFEVQDRLPWTCAVPPSPRKDERPVISCRRALVLGAGPVGLLAAMTLVDAGFETMVYSRVSGVSERVEITKAIGARFINAEQISAKNLPDSIGQVDAVLEAVGASQLAFEVLSLLGPNSIFVFTGVPGTGERMSLDVGTLMRNIVLKNQVLLGTVNAGPEDFESALQSLSQFDKRWPGILQRLITRRVPPEAAPDLLSGHGEKAIKTVVAMTNGMN